MNAVTAITPRELAKVQAVVASRRSRAQFAIDNLPSVTRMLLDLPSEHQCNVMDTLNDALSGYHGSEDVAKGIASIRRDLWAEDQPRAVRDHYDRTGERS